ncbi:venom allergen 3-like [Prorops nasuta]|uniref:venom allergen 3-like n=1 Tax=Prorops nasuta TaxID=863751 RepID=UPI0034CD6262
MCLYTTDDEVNNSCELEEHLELDNEEIRLILDHHNHYRNHIAGGKEFRGDLGPQPAAKYMMQLTWDDELAFIAQHWANQCRLSSRDTCRDVGELSTSVLVGIFLFLFGVCQNVHAVEIDRKEKMSGLEMIRLHIAAWYNQVEYFDNARVGLVNFAEWNHSSYIPLASAKITYVGCGRATYTLSFSEIPPTPHLLHSPLYLPSPLFLSHSIRDNPLPYLSFSKRVEVLVCNYGPINRSGPRELYEFGKPATCPPGTHTSAVYEFLCTNNSLEYPYEGSKPVTKLGKQRFLIVLSTDPASVADILLGNPIAPNASHSHSWRVTSLIISMIVTVNARSSNWKRNIQHTFITQ